jgi:hypothetical protein
MRPAHYFRPEACPEIRTTVRESDEEQPSSDTADTVGNDHYRKFWPREEQIDYGKGRGTWGDGPPFHHTRVAFCENIFGPLSPKII